MIIRYIIFSLMFVLMQDMRARDSVVVISEIHYNPEGGSDAQEFIELHNLFSIDVDLSNWSITGAVEYDFPSGTKIPGGGYLVVARDPAALQNATGYGTALGPWTGALNNGGEKVSLVMDAIGSRMMHEVDYSDGGKWPTAADGSGASLEKIKVNFPSNQPTSWSWSQQRNGTPGSSRGNTLLPQIVFNEIDSVSSGAFFIELYNKGLNTVDLTGYVIASSDATRNDKVLSNGLLVAGGYIIINAGSLGYTPIDGERLFLYTGSKALVLDSVKTGNFPKTRFPDGSDDFFRPTHPTPNAANSVVKNDDIVINEILYNGYPDPGRDGTPASYSSSTVVNYADLWRFENTGSAQPENWANSVHTTWPSGVALFGLEANTANIFPQTIQTPLYNAGQLAYYFEREFNFSGDRKSVV